MSQKPNKDLAVAVSFVFASFVLLSSHSLLFDYTQYVDL